jgi:predicted dehydrogenase
VSLGIQPGKKIRVAVVGAGDFGRNHARVYRELADAELVGIVDPNTDRAAKIAAEFSTKVFPDIESLTGRVDAASVAVPTVEHARVGCRLLELGIDVLVEKPMAASLAEADALLAAASGAGRILQVGHLERFNPAIVAVMPVLNRPLYFEVHRLGVFTPRSLDIDVVYDVMIHDLDILLALVGAPVVDIKAIGIPVLTDKVDIAHARLDFETGAVANVTASRVSTERVRKLRFFQQHEYISVDFTRQDAFRVRVAEPDRRSDRLQVEPAPETKFDFTVVPTEREEPLRAELRAFLESVRTRRAPAVDGAAGRCALALADQVMAGILEHGRRVQLAAFAIPQANR